MSIILDIPVPSFSLNDAIQSTKWCQTTEGPKNMEWQFSSENCACGAPNWDICRCIVDQARVSYIHGI